jgi:hypothetical protein
MLFSMAAARLKSQAAAGNAENSDPCAGKAEWRVVRQVAGQVRGSGELCRGLQSKHPAKAGCCARRYCLRVNSVQALATTLFALHFLGVALHGSRGLALALGGGLFVKLAATHFGQYTGLFAGALETTQSYVEGFVLFNFDGWHPGRTFTDYRL